MYHPSSQNVMAGWSGNSSPLKTSNDIPPPTHSPDEGFFTVKYKHPDSYGSSRGLSPREVTSHHRPVRVPHVTHSTPRENPYHVDRSESSQSLHISEEAERPSPISQQHIPRSSRSSTPRPDTRTRQEECPYPFPLREAAIQPPH